MKKISVHLLLSIIILVILCLPEVSFAQRNYIFPEVEYLLWDNNARIAGFGSIASVANSSYSEAGTWGNPALLSRREKSLGLNLSIDPLDNINIEKLYLFDANALYSLNTRNAIALQLRWYNRSMITFTDYQGSVTGDFEPVEFTLKMSYAHHFNNGFSLGGSASYIHSNLAGGRYIGVTQSQIGKAVAVGLGWNYDIRFIIKEGLSCDWSLGGYFSNLGNKIFYVKDDDGDFIPANLSVGGLITPTLVINKNVKFQLDLAYEACKLLVPTPPNYDYDSISGDEYIVAGMDPDVPVLQSYFQSFHDAPNGFKEEINEIRHKLGFEFRAVFIEKISVSLRHGRSLQHKDKGFDCISWGIGVNVFGVRISRASLDYENFANKTKVTQIGYVYTFK